MSSLQLNPRLNIKIVAKEGPPSIDEPPAAEEGPAADDKQDRNEKLLHELMVLKFRIKLCKDLYYAGMSGTSQLKKKLNSVYLKKLKKYCELNGGIFDSDLIKQELGLKMDELQSELKKLTE